MKQGFFANSNWVEVSDAQAQLDENLFKSCFEQLCSIICFYEWEIISGSWEIYYESKEELEYQGYNRDYKMARRVNRLMRMKVEFYGKQFVLEGLSVSRWSDMYKFANEILTAVADPYGWWRYCEITRQRKYFGPKKPIAKNVVC